MKKLFLALILLDLSLIGAASWYRVRHGKKVEPRAYTLAPAEFGTIEEVVSANGIVQPREVFIVGSERAGKVTAVLADFNQRVEEHDVLLRLDDRPAKERLARAKTALELARVAVKEAESNRDTADKAVTRLREMADEVRNRTDLDIATGKLRAAELAVEAARLKVREADEVRQQAELDLRLQTIRAPIVERKTSSHSTAAADHPGTGVLSEEPPSSRPRRSFVVLDRKVSLNQLIGPSSQGHLFTLASDLEHVRVTAQVGEGDIDRVRRGMNARFTVSGAGDDAKKYTGEVADIHLVPASEHGAVYYKVLIDAHNERDHPGGGSWQLRPGQTASVDVIRRTHESVWKVPSAALNLELPADQQSKEARARLAGRDNLPDHDHWQTAWTLGPDGRPWPIFVRTGGTNAQGESGIQDGQSIEVLQWDPTINPNPERSEELRFITGVPPPKKSLFSLPSLKF